MFPYIYCLLADELCGRGFFLHTSKKKKKKKAAGWEGMYREEEVGDRKWSGRCKAHTHKEQNIVVIKNRKENGARRFKERSMKNLL